MIKAFGDLHTPLHGLSLYPLNVLRQLSGTGLLLFSAATAFQGIQLAGASLQMGNLLHRDPQVHDTHILLTHAGFTLVGWQIVVGAFALIIACLISAVLGLSLLMPPK